MNNISTIINKLIIVFLIFFGLTLCYFGGYGSDEDTLPMIGVFQTLIGSGEYMSSRFTGYPVAEIVIGFISYHFGSFYINSIIFFSIIIGGIFFFISLETEIKLIKKEKLILFLILILTNHVIFFDNLEPIDYSLAFLFFSMGCFFLTRRNIAIAIIFYSICIGTRINYGLFILIFIIFNNLNQYSFVNRIWISASTIFSGSLFYLPIWFHHRLTLKWLTAARPVDQDFFGLIARFIYKSWVAFGVFASFFIIYLLIIKYKEFIKLKSFTLCFLLIFSNLLIFLYIPAELSYLQLGIICVFYLIAQNINIKIFYFLIFLNLSQWFVEINFLKIQYLSDKECDQLNAIGAKVDFSINKGRLFQFLDSRDRIRCWLHDENSSRSKKIMKGLRLK